MRRAPWVALVAVAVVVVLASVAFAAFTSTANNPQTITAASPFPGPTPTGDLKAQSRSNDGGASASQFQLGLKLVNTGTGPIDLSTVTVRYWFSHDGGANLVSACYYATFGCGQIDLGLMTVSPPGIGADRNLSVTFHGGSLAAGAAATLDQLAVRDQSGGIFDQTIDYSFLDKPSFTDNPKVTVYVGSQLVWGTEPEEAPVVTSLDVKYANLDGNDHDAQIKPGLVVENTGTTDIDLCHLTLRYWFTKDSGNGTFQGFCDYAEMSCNRVTTSFGAVTPSRTGADSYLQVGFSGGTAAVGDDTGVMQLRFNKTDYSNFNETDDYSHGSNTGYVLTSRVTAYLDGELVWGTEP